MKTLIKKTLPSSVKDFVKTKIETRKLNTLSKANYDASNLIKLEPDTLRELFRNKEIEKNWEIDKSKIKELNLPNLTGGVNLGDQKALYFLIHYFSPKKVLEIGTHIGCSSVHIALALKKFNDAQLTTVDIIDVNDESKQHWKKFNSSLSPREMLKEVDCKSIVNFVNQKSVDFLQKNEEKFDIIFLDGSHAAEIVYQELPLALDLLNPNGFVILHDFFPGKKPLWKDKSVIMGPYLAVKRLQKEKNDFKVIPLGELPWKTKLGSKVTSLAIVSAI